MTYEDAFKHFILNGVSGELIWRVTASSRAMAGSIAGSIHNKGYLMVRLKGNGYLAHRIVWLLTYGKYPNGMIDHIDGNKLNNSIYNLRDVNESINKKNSKKYSNNTSGYAGVKFNKKYNRWSACYRSENKNFHIGSFDTAQEANKAVIKAREANGEFTKRHGQKEK